MLIPRFSIRWLLALTAVAAVISLVFVRAGQNRAWAFGVATAVGTAALAFALYALLFAIAFFLARLAAALRPAPIRSPFAGEAPPPQVLAPRDPE